MHLSLIPLQYHLLSFPDPGPRVVGGNNRKSANCPDILPITGLCFIASPPQPNTDTTLPVHMLIVAEYFPGYRGMVIYHNSMSFPYIDTSALPGTLIPANPLYMLKRHPIKPQLPIG